MTIRDNQNDLSSNETNKENEKATEQSCWCNHQKECTDFVNTVKVLESIKNNAEMSRRATETVIEYVDNKKFADILKEQVVKYGDFVNRADELANSVDIILDSHDGFGQFFAKANIKMKLMSDNSIGKIAELMILGSTMGMIDLGKTLRHTPDVNPDTLALARELLMYEEDKIEAMKYHL
ncbi:MAG: hypothetical protein ACI4M0_04150 [Christensenellales bacterium]